jgi:hypothetical protein
MGDKRAIEPIETYLQGDYPKQCRAVARRVLLQLKSDDPIEGLLVLLDEETYERERSNIVRDLVRHPDNRVVKELAAVARTSDSAFMRREAIFGLSSIADRQSLLILASLLDMAWPKNLKSEWGWKGVPDFAKCFPDAIQKCLRQSSGQDFGRDRAKWETWIKTNVEQSPASDSLKAAPQE